MTKKSWLIVLAAVLIAGVGVTALALTGRGRSGTTARVMREDVTVTVESPGRLEAEIAYEIGPPSVREFWQYNLTWMIPEGSSVSVGDAIARFDATDLDDRLRDHRAALEKVLQEKEKEERNLDVALRQLRLDLVSAGGELKTLELGLSVPEELLSSIEVEQLKLERKLAGQRVDFLGEKIEFEQKLVAAKLELLDVKRGYEEGKIAYNETAKAKFDVKAPVSGLVIYIPKQNGDRWEIGEGVWMLAKILKVADVSTLRVEAAVLEVDASRIAPGQAAEISIDAVPGLVIASTIDEIGRIVHERSAQDRSKVFDAFLPLGDVDTDVLRPGMGVRVRIETEQLNDRLTIPLEAVRRSSEGTYVELIRGGATARRPVTLGRSSAGRVIVESGLEEGDRVQLPGTSS